MDKPMTKEEATLECTGWLTLAGVIIMFPVLFYVCVFLPMWLGWATRH
jgi:hypothetical protein